MKNFIKYWNRLTIQIFHQVNSMNCIRIWNLKLNRKSNKRMQIHMNIDKGDFNNGK